MRRWPVPQPVVSETDLNHGSGQQHTPMLIAALLVTLCLGGGTKTYEFGDMMAEAFCAPLLAAALYTMWVDRPKHAFWFILAIVVLFLMPLMQLFPLPPNIWASLPGRKIIFEGFRAANVQPPWLGISVAPFSTLYSTASLIPPVTVFILAIQIKRSHQLLIFSIILCFTIFSICIFAVQYLTPTAGPISLFRGAAFFANRNHLAALIYINIICILFYTISSWRISRTRDQIRLPNQHKDAIMRKYNTTVKMFSSIAIVSFLFLGLVLTASRAGIVIGFVALLFSVIINQPRLIKKNHFVKSIAISIFIFTIMIVVLIYFMPERFIFLGKDINLRRSILFNTLYLAQEYAPFGAGFGTFETLYLTVEDLRQSTELRVNRAHNDVAEFILEGGLFSLALMLICAAVSIRLFLSLLYMSGRHLTDELSLATACSLVPFLIFIHSIVDYPLRTIAISSIVSLSFAFSASYAIGFRRKINI